MNSGEVGRTPCERCDGSGMRVDGDGSVTGQHAPCPACHGYGFRSRPDSSSLPSIGRSVVLAGALVMFVVTLVVLASH